MNDDRGSERGRWHGGSTSDGVASAVRRAIALNEVRQGAAVEALYELSPGAVPEGWQYRTVTPDLIRDPLRHAETVLTEQVEVIKNGNGLQITIPGEIAADLDELDRVALHDTMIEHTLHRLNASWSYVDVVGWEPLIRPDETPILYLLTLPLGKPHKGRKLLGEEHNLSGIHFHYARLDGQRSDILFSFGHNPPEPDHPVKWERHGTNKAKFKPKPEGWNYAKRENINAVCCAARCDMAAGTRFFTPSKEAAFLLPM